MDDKKVVTKWLTDGQLAVIYRIKGLEDEHGILLWYLVENDPNFKVGETVTFQDIHTSTRYKQARYTPEAIPSDAFISIA